MTDTTNHQDLPPEDLPPTANEEIEVRDYNLPIYGMRGEFSLSAQVRVPYMIALMDLKRITSELKTHEEVSPSLDATYSLSELFQREIDLDRVQDEIVEGYLLDPQKLKFFNALTLVLLPKDQSGKITRNFEDYSNNDPVVPDPNAGHFDPWFQGKPRALFGGVQFVYTNIAGMCRIRWDRKRVDAVAVDGQHRLKAMKLWMERKNNELVDLEKPTRIPVIFLLLHEKAGFLKAGEVPQEIRGIAREIFTDLNKNAKEVDLATEIVLDDRSIESLCVRSLICSSTSEDSPPLLPLTLLRWQEANNRFDQKHYLNSLVHLHAVVTDLLDLSPPKKIDKAAGLNFVGSAQSKLGLGTPPRITYHQKDLEQYYRENYLDESGEAAIAPISSIPTQFLSSAVEGFKERYSWWILKILNEFLPYEQVLDYARGQNILSGDFGRYLSQPKSHQDVLRTELRSRYGDDWMDIVIKSHERAILAIKGDGRAEEEGGEYWAFKTIFQKAMLRLANVLFVEALETERERLGSCSEFIEFFNALHRGNALSVLSPIDGHSHFLWTFISVNPVGKKIQVASTAEKRMQSVLSLWYYGWRMALSLGKRITEDSDSENEVSCKFLLQKLSLKGANINWPGSADHAATLSGHFATPNQMAFLDPEAEGTARAPDVAKERLQAVFSAGMKAYARGRQ